MINLIYDLDDTIYETRQINSKAVQGLIDVLDNLLKSELKDSKRLSFLEEVSVSPFDKVLKKYPVSDSILLAFAECIERTEFELDIKTFSDFKLKTGRRHFLVTTGFRKLQWVKIKALGLENSFDEIIIDDILDKRRKFKKGIFQDLIKRYKLDSTQTWVIGDNPNSEIKAGKELGLRTIQIGNLESNNYSLVDFCVHHLQEVETILLEHV